MNRPATRIAALAFAGVAVAHLARLLLRVEIAIGPLHVPVWASVFAVLLPGALAVWLWKEAGEP